MEVRGRERLERSEDWALFLGSPCGRLIREYSLAELMVKYVDAEEEGQGEKEAEERYARFVRCMESREEESIDYFENMQTIAAETVQEMRARRDRKQREGAEVKAEDEEESEPR